MSREPQPHADIETHDGEWHGETWVFNLRTPRARKRYSCDACCEDIEKGLRHVSYVTSGVEAPGLETWRLHGECYLSDLSMFTGEKRPVWRWVGQEMS